MYGLYWTWRIESVSVLPCFDELQFVALLTKKQKYFPKYNRKYFVLFHILLWDCLSIRYFYGFQDPQPVKYWYKLETTAFT